MTRGYETSRQRLYRDPEHALVAGVCAGFAKFFGIGRFCVRLATLLSLILFTAPTLLAYGLAWLVLDKPPGYRSGTRRDRHRPRRGFEQDWRDMRSSVSDRLRTLDERIRDIESRVTSRDYDLDREFRRL